MTRPYRFKYINATFQSINDLNARKVLTIKDKTSDLCDSQITIWKTENFFEFEIQKFALNISTEYNSLFDTCNLTNGNIFYSFIKDSLKSCSFNPGKEITTGKLLSLIEAKFDHSENCYYRAIQKVKDRAKIGYIEGPVDLQTDQPGTILYGGGINQIKIYNQIIDTFRVDIEKDEFIIIDSHLPLKFEQFEKIVKAYFVIYGFTFGETVGDEIYYLSSDSTSFEKDYQICFKSLPEKAIIEHYPIFNRRIETQNKLIEFPKVVFQNICNNYLSNTTYSRTIHIINEGLKAPSSLVKCIMFSSVLETISTTILNSKELPTPINKAKLKKSNLIYKLKETIQNDEFLSSDDKKFLIDKKINYLNNPTFTDKTLEAFKIHNIELPNSLIEVTKYRNKYLHGSIPEKVEFGNELDDLTRAYELQFLVSILVLKFSGYSGYVQNKSAILEYHATRKKDPNKMIRIERTIYYKI